MGGSVLCTLMMAYICHLQHATNHTLCCTRLSVLLNGSLQCNMCSLVKWEEQINFWQNLFNSGFTLIFFYKVHIKSAYACLQQSLIILRWPCAVDRTLKIRIIISKAFYLYVSFLKPFTFMCCLYLKDVLDWVPLTEGICFTAKHWKV